jgi:hypothetical protein
MRRAVRCSLLAAVAFAIVAAATSCASGKTGHAAVARSAAPRFFNLAVNLCHSLRQCSGVTPEASS